jgi:hypothetical protein
MRKEQLTPRERAILAFYNPEQHDMCPVYNIPRSDPHSCHRCHENTGPAVQPFTEAEMAHIVAESKRTAQPEPKGLRATLQSYEPTEIRLRVQKLREMLTDNYKK